MVRSKLNPDINYREYKQLERDDADYDATMYEIELLGKEVRVAIGRGKTDKKDILYYPMYLINTDERVVKQIGVFELRADQANEVLDDDDDLDIDKLPHPLVYSFVNAAMLEADSRGKKAIAPAENEIVALEEEAETEAEEVIAAPEEEEEQEQEVIAAPEKEPVQKGDDDALRSKMKALALPPQTKDTAEAEHAEYKKQSDQPWIQTHMQNNNFGITDNEGGGDCLFAVIRDAYRSRGKYVEVPELRRKLAAEATEDVFQNYKGAHTMTADSIATTQAEMRALSDANAKLKQRLERTTEAKEQQAIIAESRRNAAQFKRLKSEVALSKELLQDFHFIKNVNTLEDFREMLKSCAFWADTWAISTLERILRIKLIILSSERFHAGEMGGVLQCGQLNDRVLEDQGTFEPEFYIMAEHTGSHYKLITYKGEALLTFREIPYDIKVMVTEKCMERNAGPYYLIPQFRTFREEELGLKGLEEDQAVKASIPSTATHHASSGHAPLYDDATVFQFYRAWTNRCRARDRAKPLSVPTSPSSLSWPRRPRSGARCCPTCGSRRVTTAKKRCLHWTTTSGARWSTTCKAASFAGRTPSTICNSHWIRIRICQRVPRWRKTSPRTRTWILNRMRISARAKKRSARMRNTPNTAKTPIWRTCC